MNGKIKILYVHHYPGMGGATNSLLYIVEQLDRELFEPTVLFLGEGPAVAYFKAHGIPTLTMRHVPFYPHADGARLSFISKKPWIPVSLVLEVQNAVPGLVKWFRQHQFDIVHLNTSLLLPFGKAAATCGIKVVWHIREALFQGNFGIRKEFVRNWITKYANHIIAISTVEASRLRAPEKTTVVYNYVDFKKFDWQLSGHAVRQELGIGEKEFMVLNLGGLIHSKGADFFVEAAKLLCEKYPDIRFVIAGDTGTLNRPALKGRMKLTVRQLLGLKVNKGFLVYKKIKEYGLADKVILIGMRTDIPQLLAASDMLCWTATVPHFSRPIIEAAAMKKPAVATDFPNTKETLRPNKTGLLFKNKDSKDLAKQIEAMYLQPDKRLEMGENAYELAVEQFNSQKNFGMISQKYFELMGVPLPQIQKNVVHEG